MGRILAFVAITIATVSLAVALPESKAFAQGKSLKEQLVGTWTFEALGPNPRGVFILDGGGHFVITIIGEGRRKFASNSRLQGTPEENAAAVHGAIAYFGTYTVSEADHTLNFHIDRGNRKPYSPTLIAAWRGLEKELRSFIPARTKPED
jgi:hypothetical protein